MPAGTFSKKRMIVDSDEEDVSFPQAGPSTFKRPRHSPSIEEPQVAPPTDKGKSKERAQPSHGSSSIPRNPSSSKAPAESRAQRRRKAPRTVVTVTPSTTPNSGDSPADSVPTLVSSDHEDDNPPDPSSSRTVVDPKPQPQPTVATSEDHDELARLRKEVASKDALIQKQHDAFSALQTALQCQICLEIMWDPYITSCGHTSCLSCLQAWFKAPPADHNPGDAPPLAPHLRRKTCPTCRAPIRTRPTPVFIAKSIIGIAKPFFEPSALASESEARPVPIVPGANPGQPVDPWLGIFAPHRAGEGGRHRHHDEDVDGVIEDAEDGVLRCVDCLYEIYDGVCAGCGRIFNDLQDDGGFTDEDEDDEEGHPAFPFFDLRLHGLFHPWHPEGDPWHDEDDGVESDEGSDVDDRDNEMHDFIVSDGHEDEEEDDENDDDGVEPDEGQNLWVENHQNGIPNQDRVDSQFDDDEWSEQGEIEELRRRSARIARGVEGRHAHLRDGLPEDSEDERRLRAEQARERELYMFGNGEYPERAQPRVAGPSGARNRLVVQSDDEDDEDDGPADEERDDAGGSAYGADGERGWIGDQELYQGYSDDEDDGAPQYGDDDDGQDYHDDDGFYSDGRDWGGNDYSEDDEASGW